MKKKIYTNLFLAAIILLVPSCSLVKKEQVKIHITPETSDLVKDVFMEFDKTHPEYMFHVNTDSACTQLLLDGKVEACFASSGFSPEDSIQATTKNATLSQQVIAVDGLLLIVHTTNITELLTKEDITAVFNGQILDWKQLGGLSNEINFYLKSEYGNPLLRTKLSYSENSKNAIYYSSDSDVIDAVSQDFGGIGIIRLTSLKDAIQTVKLISIILNRNEKIFATPVMKNIISGLYPYSQQIILKSTQGKADKIFEITDFIGSDKGHIKIAEKGLFYTYGKQY